MAGDEDRLSLFRAERYTGRHRMAVGLGIARVEELHCFQVYLAALEDQAEPKVEVALVLQDGLERLLRKGIDGDVILAEYLRVVGVGRQALHTEEQGMGKGGEGR